MGVRRLFTDTPEYKIVGEAATATDAFEIIDRAAPDIVLMDIALPGMDGIRATREILRRDPRARVLIHSAHDQINDVVDAFTAGASGYALKEDMPAALIAAVRAVGRGARYVSPALASRLARFEDSRPRTGEVLEILSRREREVFVLAADCMFARDIALKLGIARKTVDTHLNRINGKLGLRNMAELVRLAASLGLLEGRASARAVPSTKPEPTKGGALAGSTSPSVESATAVMVVDTTTSREVVQIERDGDAVSQKPIEPTTLVLAIDEVVRMGPKRVPLMPQPSRAQASERTNSRIREAKARKTHSG